MAKEHALRDGFARACVAFARATLGQLPATQPEVLDRPGSSLQAHVEWWTVILSAYCDRFHSVEDIQDIASRLIGVGARPDVIICAATVAIAGRESARNPNVQPIDLQYIHALIRHRKSWKPVLDGWCKYLHSGGTLCGPRTPPELCLGDRVLPDRAFPFQSSVRDIDYDLDAADASFEQCIRLVTEAELPTHGVDRLAMALDYVQLARACAERDWRRAYLSQ